MRAGVAATTPAEPLSRQRIEELRQHFPILETSTYLISNSLGAMPSAVEAELSLYSEQWRTRGVRAWHDGWWEMPVTVGDLVAPFLGVGAGQVAMQPNVTLATAVFLSCFDYPAERNRIVTTSLDFPSVSYLLSGEQRRGAEIRVVASADGIGIANDDILNAIDERTRLVVTSHVLFRSAFVQDARAIAERCRSQGAVLLLDVYQSAGTLPLSLADWGVDAAVGGCLKWLCGGPGNAFLWVRPGLDRTLEPQLTGWQSHQEPFAFAQRHDRVDAGAWRFLTGTPNIPALFAARPALELLVSFRHHEIRQRSLTLTDRLIEAAEAAGFSVRTPTEPALRGGTVTIAHPHAEALCQGLLERDVLCDYRPESGIRLSPHIYSTEAECDHAIEELIRLRAEL